MSARAITAGARVMSLRPQDILVPERIGFLHEDKATALGRLIAADGQRDPIKVMRNLPSKSVGDCIAEGKKPWRLVVGHHRLQGCALEGLDVLALEVTGQPDELIDLEASENLHRRPLGPIERAKFTATLAQAAQERIAREHGDLDQYQRGAKARWDRVKHGEERAEGALRDETEYACAKFAQAYGWEECVQDAMGMSRRSIHYDLTLYRLIIEPFPDLAEALSRHPVVGGNASQIKRIAEVFDEATRRQVIEELLTHPAMKAEDAIEAAGLGSPKAGDVRKDIEKFTSQITGGWERLNLAEKRRYLPKFFGLLTPDMKQDLRRMLDAERTDDGSASSDDAPLIFTPRKEAQDG